MSRRFGRQRRRKLESQVTDLQAKLSMATSMLNLRGAAIQSTRLVVSTPSFDAVHCSELKLLSASVRGDSLAVLSLDDEERAAMYVDTSTLSRIRSSQVQEEVIRHLSNQIAQDLLNHIHGELINEQYSKRSCTTKKF